METRQANEMTDLITHAGADLYLHGYHFGRVSGKRSDQMLLRLARAHGLPELVRLAKNSLERGRPIL
jgi:hypothetical protein